MNFVLLMGRFVADPELKKDNERKECMRFYTCGGQRKRPRSGFY